MSYPIEIDYRQKRRENGICKKGGGDNMTKSNTKYTVEHTIYVKVIFHIEKMPWGVYDDYLMALQMNYKLC